MMKLSRPALIGMIGTAAVMVSGSHAPVLTAAAGAPQVLSFHHVHMNVVDPLRSVAFYTSAFERTKRVMVAGWEAVQSEDIFILFNKVPRQAAADWDTAFWHFGWNSPDTTADYQRISAKGVQFFRVPPPSGHMVAPDGNDVEIAGAGTGTGGVGPTAFNHVHFMSDAPLCAAAWYEDVLGLRRDPPARPGEDCHVPFSDRADPGNQIHRPSARVFAGDILVFLYPNQKLQALTPRPVERDTPLVSPRGRVLDHVAFTVADVPAAVKALKARGVNVLEDVHPFGDSSLKAAMIEGPDAMALELVEKPGSGPLK